MTSAAKSIIASFEHLPKYEQLEVVAKLCELASRWDTAPLSDDALNEAAAETFRELDEREAT